jgi:hypothetical protein
MTAATPTRDEPFSRLFSTRTTLPMARINTSEPRVTSEGSVSVISSSAPALRSWSIVKNRPRVEMSRVFPFLEDSVSTGARIMTGRDRSYRRAVRRSVIFPWTPVVGSCTQSLKSIRVQSAFQNGDYHIGQTRFLLRRIVTLHAKSRWPELSPKASYNNTQRTRQRPGKAAQQDPSELSRPAPPYHMLTITKVRHFLSNSYDLCVPNAQLIAVGCPLSYFGRQARETGPGRK